MFIDFFYSVYQTLSLYYQFDFTVFIANLLVISLACVGIIASYIAILGHRIYTYSFIRTKTRLINALNELLAETVLNTDESLANSPTLFDKELQQFKSKYLKSKLEKTIIIDGLMLFHRDFSGITSENIEFVYFKLGLKEISIHRLKYGSWNKKAKAIRELSRFKVIESANLVAHYINAKNSILRLEAQVGYLKLNQEHPFNFLDKLEGPMSEWHQLNLFNAVIQLDRLEVPNFEPWLRSSNNSVILFALKMTSHFRQLASVSTVIGLLNNPSGKVVRESIRTLGTLEAEDAVPGLTLIYNDKTQAEKALIIQSLALIGSANSFEFIAGKIQDTDFEISMAAVYALTKYGEMGQQKLHAAKKAGNLQLKQIITQVLDEQL